MKEVSHDFLLAALYSRELLNKIDHNLLLNRGLLHDMYTCVLLI